MAEDIVSIIQTIITVVSILIAVYFKIIKKFEELRAKLEYEYNKKIEERMKDEVSKAAFTLYPKERRDITLNDIITWLSKNGFKEELQSLYNRLNSATAIKIDGKELNIIDFINATLENGEYIIKKGSEIVKLSQEAYQKIKDALESIRV